MNQWAHAAKGVLGSARCALSSQYCTTPNGFNRYRFKSGWSGSGQNDNGGITLPFDTTCPAAILRVVAACFGPALGP